MRLVTFFRLVGHVIPTILSIEKVSQDLVVVGWQEVSDLYLWISSVYFNSCRHTFAAPFFHISQTPFFKISPGVDRGMWNVLYLFLNHKQFEAIFNGVTVELPG